MSKITLRLLLVSGDSHDFKFDVSETADDIVKHVITHWPSDWEEVIVGRSQFLRLIYQGKIISQSTKLSDLSLKNGKYVAMHLVVREHSPEEHQNGGHRSVSKTQQSTCCTIF